MRLSIILNTLFFFITFTSTSQIIGTTYKLDSIEIAQYDLPTELTWYNAKRECKELGKGWRLPTAYELDKMYNNKALIGNFVNTNYWSSTESSTNAKMRYLQNSVATLQSYTDDKRAGTSVRCLRD